MRVLIISQYFWPENFRVNELSEELIKLGHKVTILTGYPNYPSGKIFEEFKKNKSKFYEYKGAEIIRVPLLPRKDNKFNLLLNYISFLITSIFLGYFIKGDQQVKYFILFGVPLILLLTSLILVFIVMNKFKDKSIMGKIKLSNRNRKRLKKYKDMFVSIIVFIILALVGMLSFSASENTDEMKAYVDYYVTILLVII